MDLPFDFLEKMKNLLGDQADSFFAELERPATKGITVDYNSIDRLTFDHLADFEKTQVKHIDNGYHVGNFKFSSHILNHLGIIYSQEPSAMYPVEMLNIQPGDIVLDVCSAPGGKSIQILEKLKNEGFLVSNEIVFNRSKILFENLSKFRYNNFAITCNSPEDFEKTKLKFDKILVDAPCGGEGMLRKKDFDLNAYNPDAIDTNACRQLKILNSVKELLKNGGRLVYSTCTYDTRENEEVIAKFLKENPEFKIIQVDYLKDVMTSGIKIENFDTNFGYRRYPHLCQGEGQFMIALEKTCEEYYPHAKFFAKNYEQPNKKELDLITKNLKASTNINDINIIKRNDAFFSMPKFNLDFKNLNVIHIGCMVGTIIKNNFKFSHTFFRMYGNDFKNELELDPISLNKYLHGEEIDTSQPDGIYAISYENIYLSGGKVTNGKLKNNYPKELRI